MSDMPPSPRAARLAAPSWLNGRLVLGVLLVLVSVVVGARVLSAADRTQLVWSARQDLPAGVTLTDDLLVAQRVRLFASGDHYLSAGGTKPTGYVLRRYVAQGELLPREAVDPQEQPEQRFVSVPVDANHLPADLATAQVVDVYVTPDPRKAATTTSDGEGTSLAPRLVLRGVPVHLVPKSGGFTGSGSTRAVVLAVAPDDVAALVTAIAQGTVDLVRVPQPPAGTAAAATRAAPAAPVDSAAARADRAQSSARPGSPRPRSTPRTAQPSPTAP